MAPFGWPRATSIVLGMAAAIAIAAPAALGQSSVKAIYEKYRLLGTFAIDCYQPASKQNFYYVNRLLDDGRVQSDVMSGATTRDFVVFIDKAEVRKAGEIALSGTREGKPVSMVWRVEADRLMSLQRVAEGKEYGGGGRWVYRCGAPG